MGGGAIGGLPRGASPDGGSFGGGSFGGGSFARPPGFTSPSIPRGITPANNIVAGPNARIPSANPSQTSNSGPPFSLPSLPRLPQFKPPSLQLPNLRLPFEIPGSGDRASRLPKQYIPPLDLSQYQENHRLFMVGRDAIFTTSLAGQLKMPVAAITTTQALTTPLTIKFTDRSHSQRLAFLMMMGGVLPFFLSTAPDREAMSVTAK